MFNERLFNVYCNSYLLTDRPKMSTHFRGHSIDASIPTKFWFIYPSSLRGEDSNVKSEQTNYRHQVMIKANLAKSFFFFFFNEETCMVYINILITKSLKILTDVG